MSGRVAGNGYREGYTPIDPSLHDWVILFEGMTAFIGKLSDGATEESIRQELAADMTRTTTATLMPVYLLTSVAPTVWVHEKGPATLSRQISIALLGNCFLGRGAVSRMHVVLDRFEWLANQPDEPRRFIAKLLEQANQQHRIAEAGIVSGQAVSG